MSEPIKTETVPPVAGTPPAGVPPDSKPPEQKVETKPPEQKVETKPEEKPGEKSPPVEPKAESEEISIEVPQGMQADSKMLEQFVTAAKEAGLKKPQAQKIATFYFGLVQQAQKGVEEGTKQYEAKCIEVLKKDPEFGGTEFEANKEIAKTAFIKFGSESLFKELESMGLGNHPGLMKFAHKVGQAIREDPGSPKGGNGPPPGKSREQLLRERYDKTPQMFNKI